MKLIVKWNSPGPSEIQSNKSINRCPSAHKLNRSVEVDLHNGVVEDVNADNGWIIVPMEADVMPIPSSVRAVPARFDLTEFIAAV